MKPLAAFQDNPFLAQWMSTLTAMTSMWRGPWLDQLIERQRAMMTDFNEQALNFWTRGAETPSRVQEKTLSSTSDTDPSMALVPIPVAASASTYRSVQ